jgi:multidrug efflux pump
MISRFFIDRPIFATVISVVITLAGGVAVFTLPVAQYPDVTPPTVQVTASYPGANANTLRDTVAAPIEEQVSGVEGMLYMSSICTNSGSYTLTVTFQSGTDSDMAQVLVQNRVALALPVVPALVQNEGVTVKKQSPATLMIINLIGDGDKNDPVYLSNYATIFLKDELARVEGVAGINYLGQRDYSMRAWLDPDRLAALHLNAYDVVTAIAQQNVQVAAGQVGQPPVPGGQQFQLTINTKGRLSEAEEFGDIVVKVDQGIPPQTVSAGSAPIQTPAALPSSAPSNPLQSGTTGGRMGGVGNMLNSSVSRSANTPNATSSINSQTGNPLGGVSTAGGGSSVAAVRWAAARLPATRRQVDLPSAAAIRTTPSLLRTWPPDRPAR